MNRLIPFIFVFASIVLFTTAVVDAQTVKQVSFVHRHGARDEPIVQDGKLIWDFAQLTVNGEKMMLNLGTLLRNTYGDFITAFDPTVYDARSGDSDRCIQSVHGVLRAFFNESSDFTPLVKYVPLAVDWLMEFNYNFPNVVARPEWYYAFQNNDTLAREILTASEIETLADTFGSWCKDTPMLCALFAADAVQCRISNTNTTSAALRTLFDAKLLPIQYASDKHLYGFHASDPYAVTGSSGYDLVAKMMRDATDGDMKVHHYSAHDSTVVGALNAFGSILVEDNDAKWFPRFGAILAVTTYTNGNVSFSYAEPEQAAASSLDYTNGLPPVAVRCVKTDGTVYTATQCPIADAWRYVNRTAPTVPNRYCYLRPEDQCQSTDTVPAKPCNYYRQHCPETACGTDAVLDISKEFTCVPFVTRQKLSHYAVAASLSGAIGAAIGICVGVFAAWMLTKAGEKEERRRLVVEQMEQV